MEERHAERERIARELHDTLLQGIQALLFRLQAWACDPTIPAARREEIAAVMLRTSAIVVEGRDRIVALRRVDGPRVDLVAALEAVGKTESAAHAVRFEIIVRGRRRLVSAHSCEQLLGIGREGLRNALRHARASRIEVTLDYRPRSLHVSIADDGCGIDGSTHDTAAQRGHFGLMGMRERAAELGARFRVGKNGTVGTRISVVVAARVAFAGARSRLRPSRASMVRARQD